MGIEDRLAFVEQRTGLLDFWTIYERLLEQAQQTWVEAALREAGHAEPPDPAMAQLRDCARYAVTLMRHAVGTGDWTPYREQVSKLGAKYAELGISFEHWYSALRMFQHRLIPTLVEAYADTPLRLTEALEVATEFAAMVMRLASRGYFEIRQEDRFRTLVESIKGYAIYMLDPDGIIRSWNAGAQAIKGYLADEVIGRHFSIFFPHADRQAGRPAQLLARAAQHGRVEEEATRVRKDGSQLWADVVITAIRGEDGALVGFAKVVRDLSERKRIEAALEQRTRELEHSNRELETFSYSAAHDLRAPLRAMSSFSEALLEEHAAQLDQEAVRYLSKIHASARRMATLIDGLLDLSRLGRSRLQLAEVDLSALARSVIDQLTAAEPDRRVDTQVADGLTAYVDPRLVRTLFENLIGNAWKFTRKTVAPRLEVGTTDGRTFFVRDNGAGFDLASADKLFVPFERMHADSEFPGTGIGLATAQRIVERHGGRIWAEAQPGLGATFSFLLATP